MMTGKRFRIYQDIYEVFYIEDIQHYSDKKLQKGYKIGHEEDVKYEDVLKVVDLLNELYNENKQLKQHIIEVEKDNERLEQITSQFKMGDIINLKFANEIIDDQRRKIKLLKEENEQLKQQIKDMKIRFKRKYDYEFDEIVDELW